MSNTSTRHHPKTRPGLLVLGIVLVGLHGVIWTALTLGVFQSTAYIARPVALAILLIASVAAIVAAVGMWLWKRWGWTLFLVAGIATAATALAASGNLIIFFGSFLQVIIAAYLIYPQLKHFS